MPVLSATGLDLRDVRPKLCGRDAFLQGIAVTSQVAFVSGAEGTVPFCRLRTADGSAWLVHRVFDLAPAP